MAPIDETATIKRYAYRRLYQIGTAANLNRENLVETIEDDDNLVVFDTDAILERACYD